MSEWFEITDPKDIEISDNGETIEVWFDSDKNGNKYVDIPISLIAEVIGAELKKGRGMNETPTSFDKTLASPARRARSERAPAQETPAENHA